MIASRLGLLIVWACAGVLAVALWLDLRTTRVVPDREIAPAVEATKTKSIEWSGGPIPIRIERDTRSSTTWKWADPIGEADRRPIEDLLATLRGARWHRREKASAAGTLSNRVTIGYDGPAGDRPATLSISIGQLLPGGDQQWIVVADDALLVDTWVVRALVPDPVALRIRRPFAAVASANELEMGSFILRGIPRRIVKLAGLPVALYANPALVDDFERALGEIETLAIPRGKVPVDTNFRGTRIGVGGSLVAVEAGHCPEPNRDLHAIVGPSIGSACVSEAAWTKLLAAAAVFDIRDDVTLRQSALVTLVEPRPVPADVSSVTFTDGGVLQLAKRPTVADKTGNRDADPARVAELLAVLATPAEPVALPTTPPVAKLVVVGPRSDQPAITIALHGNGVIARDNEPIALHVGVGSYEILVRGGRVYVDPTLWSEEPTTIQSIKIGDITYTRAAVVGEWTRDKPGPVDAPAVETLAGALATPRSLGVPAVAANPRIVVLTIKAPIGDARTRTIAIQQTTANCTLTFDAASHAVDPQLCKLVDQLSR